MHAQKLHPRKPKFPTEAQAQAIQAIARMERAERQSEQQASEIVSLNATIESLRHDAAAALMLVSRIRFALGDEVVRMQEELIAFCEAMAKTAAQAEGLKTVILAAHDALQDQYWNCPRCGHAEPTHDMDVMELHLKPAAALIRGEAAEAEA